MVIAEVSAPVEETLTEANSDHEQTGSTQSLDTDPALQRHAIIRWADLVIS